MPRPRLTTMHVYAELDPRVRIPTVPHFHAFGTLSTAASGNPGPSGASVGSTASSRRIPARPPSSWGSETCKKTRSSPKCAHCETSTPHPSTTTQKPSIETFCAGSTRAAESWCGIDRESHAFPPKRPSTTPSMRPPNDSSHAADRVPQEQLDAALRQVGE
jgi:hypothetical protein